MTIEIDDLGDDELHARLVNRGRISEGAAAELVQRRETSSGRIAIRVLLEDA